MIDFNNIRVIAFDADDTLWDCQSHFEAVENHLYRLIAPFCDVPAQELFKTESGNMADLGYGCKAFTISVIETALRVQAIISLLQSWQNCSATASRSFTSPPPHCRKWWRR